MHNLIFTELSSGPVNTTLQGDAIKEYRGIELKLELMPNCIKHLLDGILLTPEGSLLLENKGDGDKYSVSGHLLLK